MLAAAYGSAVAPAVLGNIGRALEAWLDGDECLAQIHLAHSGLRPPEDLRTAACRLFIAESAMKAGMSSRAVLQALKISGSYVDAIEKAYSPDEPRVPAGSGRTSGEWTSGSSANGGGSASENGTDREGAQDASPLARMPLPASSFLAELDGGQIAELGAYASRLLGLGPIAAAAAAFGLLFIPSPNDLRDEGDVPEIPGLRYFWKRDETALHLTYGDPDGGQRTFSAQLDGDVFRHSAGRVVGRVLSGSNLAIDVAAISSDLVDKDEPRMCPAPGPDKPSNELGRAYESYVKSIVNPYPRTTPPRIGFQLPRIRSSPVSLSIMTTASMRPE